MTAVDMKRIGLADGAQTPSTAVSAESLRSIGDVLEAFLIELDAPVWVLAEYRRRDRAPGLADAA